MRDRLYGFSPVADGSCRGPTKGQKALTLKMLPAGQHCVTHADLQIRQLCPRPPASGMRVAGAGNSMGRCRGTRIRSSWAGLLCGPGFPRVSVTAHKRTAVLPPWDCFSSFRTIASEVSPGATQREFCMSSKCRLRETVLNTCVHLGGIRQVPFV